MTMTTNFSDGSLTVSRLYDAPREAVFEAWIETAKVQQWWGCGDTTKVRSDIEARVGGKYNHQMTIHGNEYPAKSTLIEYDPPARLAYETEQNDMAPKMTVTVDFKEEGGKTRVTLVHSGIPEGMGEIITGGWSAAFGKLETFLAKEAA